MQKQRENLFICYCEEDKRWLTKFQKALAPLTRKEQFKIWDHTNIAATTKWYQEITNQPRLELIRFISD